MSKEQAAVQKSRAQTARRPQLEGAALFIPKQVTLAQLSMVAQSCRGCDLYAHATQAVCGEGPQSSRIMFVGEQPGDQEDRQGRPFIGPAGRLLDAALDEAGIDRSHVYVTNAVKHFKFEERGKRRLHKRPRVAEIKACRPWLETEVHLVKPQAIVCLGVTAAQSILGSDYRHAIDRATFVPHPWAPHVAWTIHPSAILRVQDSTARRIEHDHFVADLKQLQNVILQP
ncbi:MAG TPA: UdgX family uracil-DNA binding protein [Bryobacteraceae bacterium]|jgi:DNA polymerase|nr:UdgX family uracil-DNA binding protein [Bryobacteraceae bacterium]